jgi:hypothetical protein
MLQMPLGGLLMCLQVLPATAKSRRNRGGSAAVIAAHRVNIMASRAASYAVFIVNKLLFFEARTPKFRFTASGAYRSRLVGVFRTGLNRRCDGNRETCV